MLKTNRILQTATYAAISFIVMIAVLCGCNKNPKGLSLESDRFEELDKEGLVIGKHYKFSYIEQNCQKVINKKRRIIHLQTDTQSSYMRVNLDKIPSAAPAPEDEVYFTIAYKSQGDATENVISMGMIVLKTEEGKIWAWNEDNKTGVIIKLY